MTYILLVLSARFQLKNWSAPARLKPENSSSNLSLIFQSKVPIMPTKLLLILPNFQTFLRPWLVVSWQKHMARWWLERNQNLLLSPLTKTRSVIFLIRVKFGLIRWSRNCVPWIFTIRNTHLLGNMAFGSWKKIVLTKFQILSTWFHIFT